MVDDWCGACGGAGYIDELAARRLGLKLKNGRTDTCPVCKGSGQRPTPNAEGIHHALDVLAIALLAGTVLAWLAHKLGVISW